MKKNSWVKKRHSISFMIIGFFVKTFIKIKYKIRFDKYIIKKNEPSIVICNHVTTLDPLFLNFSFNRLLYFVASDDMTKIKYVSWWLNYLVAVIPKSKGKADINTVKTMKRVLKEGGSVAIFPEGNRTLTGKLCFISDAIGKFIKSCKVPVVIYNINGGYGLDPRWGKSSRKGMIETKLKRVIKQDELENLTIDEINNIIRAELQVKDVPSLNEYRSKRKAEKIERVLFLCPECNKVSSLHSQGDNLSCECGLKLKYSNFLTILDDNKPYKYDNVEKWNNYQLEFIKSYDISINREIFCDEKVEFWTDNNRKNEIVLKNSKLILTNKELKVTEEDKEFSFDIKLLDGVAILGKAKMEFRYLGNIYIIKTNKKIRDDFNPVKYVYMINHIKNINDNREDDYFGI